MPVVLRTSSSHEEGCERIWAATVKEFTGENGAVRSARLIRVDWRRENGRNTFREIPGSEFELKAELVLIAMGFVHPEHGPLWRNSRWGPTPAATFPWTGAS